MTIFGIRIMREVDYQKDRQVELAAHIDEVNQHLWLYRLLIRRIDEMTAERPRAITLTPRPRRGVDIEVR